MIRVRTLTLALTLAASAFGCSKDPEVGCAQGNAADCFASGVKYDFADHGTRDLGRAAGYYRKGCDLGDAPACDNLGLMHAEGVAVPKNAELAFALYSQGCAVEYPVACFHVARARETGRGTPADANEAARLYQRVCATEQRAREGNPGVEKAVASACFNLGSMKLRGLGVPVDLAEGRRLLELGCTRGIADSCATWGVALGYMSGSEPPDLERAVELFRRACASGSGGGCYNLALAYRDGDGLPRNKLRADEMFTKACTLGHDAACADAPGHPRSKPGK